MSFAFASAIEPAAVLAAASPTMSLLLASAAMTAAAMMPACSWNAPGRHPYRGTPMEAVSRYVDIPAATRDRLAAKIAAGSADDDVIITRDAIEGRASYGPAITDMHFGRRTVCERVTRERWPATAREPAKVYCADGHCLIVPRICGNISRVRAFAGTGGAGGLGGGGPAVPLRPGAIPVPAGAPEVDIDAADAMAELSARRPAPAAPPTLGHPFANWTPGPGTGWSRPPDAALPAIPAAPVPEPAGWLMFLIGAASVVLYARFRK